VLEFRKEFAVEGPKKTMLLTTDGRIVDLYGNEQTLFLSSGEFVKYDDLGYPIIDTTSDLEAYLYVVIRHRNHAAVVSNSPVHFIVGQSTFVDFTTHHNVMGGSNTMRRIDRLPDGNFL
jgi:hypothetical protein